MEMVNKTAARLMAIAAIHGIALVPDEILPDPVVPSRPRKPLSAKQTEIKAWNDAVDARKRAKRAAQPKGGPGG